MDSIIINTEKEFLDVFEWGKLQGFHNFRFDQIPMNAAKILIDSKIELVFINVDSSLMFLYLERDNNAVGHWVIKKMTKEIILDTSLSNSNFLTANSEKMVNGFVNFWKALMMYLLKFKSDPKKIDNDKKIIVTQTKRNANRKKYTVYISTSTYKLNSPVIKKKVDWKLESWGVRGHIRKLKNGIEIFIRPYTKGNGNKNPKDYRL
jgi:hypothetical protein